MTKTAILKFADDMMETENRRKRKMKQCPRCAKLNEDSEEKCKCGFGFNHPELTFEGFKQKYIHPIKQEEMLK